MWRPQSNRVNVVLDDERAVKLRRLAERTHTNPGTLARSLLSTELDEADPDPRSLTALLDRIDGAWEDAATGIEEVRAGKGVPLDGRDRHHAGRALGSSGHVAALTLGEVTQEPV